MSIFLNLYVRKITRFILSIGNGSPGTQGKMKYRPLRTTRSGSMNEGYSE